MVSPLLPPRMMSAPASPEMVSTPPSSKEIVRRRSKKLRTSTRPVSVSWTTSSPGAAGSRERSSLPASPITISSSSPAEMSSPPAPPKTVSSPSPASMRSTSPKSLSTVISRLGSRTTPSVWSSGTVEMRYSLSSPATGPGKSSSVSKGLASVNEVASLSLISLMVCRKPNPLLTSTNKPRRPISSVPEPSARSSGTGKLVPMTWPLSVFFVPVSVRVYRVAGVTCAVTKPMIGCGASPSRVTMASSLGEGVSPKLK